MADKSLIEKLNQTDNSKITKFVKVLNEINDSSARTRVINLLNSIEQDIYILDSLNTNVDTNLDKDRIDSSKILTEKFEKAFKNIKGISINDKEYTSETLVTHKSSNLKKVEKKIKSINE